MPRGIGLGIGRKAFSPRDIDSLVLWFRADLGTTLSGSDITEWKDQSGNNNTLEQALTASRPELQQREGPGGMSQVFFDGVDEFFDIPSVNSVDQGDDYTCIFVHDPQGTQVSNITVLGWTGSLLIMTGRTGMVHISDPTFKVGPDHFTGNQILTWVIDSGATEFRFHRNGAMIGSGSYDGTWGSWNGPRFMSVGGGSPTGYGNGPVSEAMLFNKVLSDEELERVHSYLLNRYQLENNPINILGDKLEAWYRSDRGITLSGSQVQQWDDLSGNAFHLSTTSGSDNQPTYNVSGGPNNCPYLDFDHIAGQALWNESMALAQPNDVWAVAKPSKIDNAARRFIEGWPTVNQRTMWSGDSAGEYEVNMYAGAGPITLTGVTGSHWHKIRAYYDSTDSEIQADTAVEGTVIGDAGTGAAAAISVGGLAPAWQGDPDFAELIITTEKATDEQRTAISAYLDDRYGQLSGSL